MKAIACLGLAALAVGCGGSPTAPARDDVFYLHGAGIVDRSYSYEIYYPPLDTAATDRLPRAFGVGLFLGDVRMSRPVDWSIRAADYTPEHRFVSYQSPRQFVFSVYERVDPVTDSWPTLLGRYEGDVAAQGSDLLASRIPTATANAQGRSYVVRTKLSSKPELYAFAHEVLVRSPERVMLVQITHPENIESSVDEMAAAVRSLLVY